MDSSWGGKGKGTGSWNGNNSNKSNRNGSNNFWNGTGSNNANQPNATGSWNGATGSWNGNTSNQGTDWPQTQNTDQWGATAGDGNWAAPPKSPPKSTSGSASNNVGPGPIETMPGSWDPAPAWGDPTAAASTGGALDNQVDDGMPYAGW